MAKKLDPRPWLQRSYSGEYMGRYKKHPGRFASGSWTFQPGSGFEQDREKYKHG